MSALKFICAALFAVLLAGCGGDEVENNSTPDCPAGTDYNPILDDCVRLDSNGNENNDPVDGEDMGAEPEPDLGEGGEDAGVDMEQMQPDLGCMTDEDGDGSISMRCGGDDCDDTDPRRAPGSTELCDDVDNDCDEQNNEDLDCSVLAHSSSRLYRVDFFGGTYQDLGPTVENLWDIDTHPDGTTYGIAGNRLYRYDESDGSWTAASGSLSFGLTDPNGFCIDNEGNAFITGGTTLRSLDLTAGTSTAIGSMSPASSSGDCVVNKGNLLFMSSSHTNPDSFVRINGGTGASMTVGQTSTDQIWGLTAAYSRVFGFTFGGDVVEIDVQTGATTPIVSFPELSFYGAASTALR